VIVAVFVVISHITLVLATGWVGSSTAYANVFVGSDGFTFRITWLSWVLARVGGVGFPLASLSVVFFGVGSSTAAVVSLGCVDAAVEVLFFTVVGAVLNVDLGLRVSLVWFTVAEVGSLALGGVTLVPRQGTSTERRREVRKEGEAVA
jgi:hypothetical protein